MLVTRRKKGDVLRIGPDVVLRVLEATPAGVRLGVEAPKTRPVLRKPCKQAPPC